MSEIETYFLVAINKDGTITTYSDLPEEPLERERSSTNYDVYETARQVVQEFESNLLADKVAGRMAAILAMSQPTPADVVKDALKERNINPESPTSNQ